MKKILYFLLFFLWYSVSFSQIKILDSTDTENFPIIKFQVNARNPNVLNTSDFILKEKIDSQIVIDSFGLKHIKDSISYSDSNKCVLIMVEGLSNSERYEQNNTFLAGLYSSLDKFIIKGDEIKIVSFALPNKEKLLYNINLEFTDNIADIRSSIGKYRIPTNDFTNKDRSDLTGAIVNGVEMLETHESNLPKSILILSEEKPNNPSLEVIPISEAIKKAKEKGVVINTIKYNRHKYETYNLSTLSSQTYGERRVLTSSSGLGGTNKSKQRKLEKIIPEIINNSVKRSRGNKYEFVFKTKNVIKDGDRYNVTVEIVDSEDQILSFQYKAPGNWVIAQFQKHLYISITVTLILLIILFFISKKIYNSYLNKVKARKEEIESQKEKSEFQQQEIDRQNNEIAEIKRQEDQRNKLEDEKYKAEQEKALVEKMLSIGGGKFPILKVIEKTKSKHHEINKPLYNVGRNPDNNLTIKNPNISRNHFSIKFNGNNYSLKDLGSTNGTLVNGFKYEKTGENTTTLKDGDIIEVTEVTIIFYK